MSDTHAVPATSEVRPPNIVHVTWDGDHRFDAGRPGGPLARIDGSGHTGQTPPDILLSALATCSAIDVVDILAKRRTPVEKLSVSVSGARRTGMPRRFEHIVLTYHIDGAGIELIHAERAVQLAFEKYCSVSATLAPDIVSETVVVVNGSEGPRTRQKMFTAVNG